MASLWQLSFGSRFKHPIDGVVWPAQLRQLSLGNSSNKPIGGVAWPASLQRLSFGKCFNNGVAQPFLQKRLTVDPVAGVVVAGFCAEFDSWGDTWAVKCFGPYAGIPNSR